jgi:pimeloyl-ACP methyl ester carboxylesterase
MRCPLQAFRSLAAVHLVPSTDGVQIAVHDLGGDAGMPPLLLAHANGCHAHVFQPLVDAGLATTHHCIGLDFRGHGDSKVPEQLTYEWEGFGADVLAVLADIAAPPGGIVGVGHSMGGAALLIAELARPGTFGALYLFEPIVPPPMEMSPPPDNVMAASAERRREEFESAAAAVANFASKGPLNQLRADALHAYVHGGFVVQPDGSVRIKCRGATEAQIYRMAGGHGTFGRLADVTCPVTIAMGQDIGMGPSAFAPAAAERLPRGRLEIFDHLGHFGPLEAPNEIARHIASAFSQT